MTFRRSLILSSLIVLVGVFLFTRFYRIETSLLYFNDMGRDSLVLLDWLLSGKPPLLGPQTSALPFNQSAVYYYLLFPAFVLLHHSAFSAVVTNAVFYIVSLIVSVFLARKNSHLLRLVLITFALMILHPQFIIQNRFVWNPSFVGPSILVAFVSFAALIEKWSWWKAALFSLSIALAVSLNYSALPVLAAFGFVAVFKLRWKCILLGVYVAGALFLMNSPTVFFELRHQFLLTHMMLTQPRPPQPGAVWSVKIPDLIQHTTSFAEPEMRMKFLVLFALSILLAITRPKKLSHLIHVSDLFSLTLVLFLLTTLITILIPVGVQSHYVFGVIMTAVFCLAALPIAFMLPLLAVLVVLWSPPILKEDYFRPVHRTVAQMNACFEAICQQEKDPLFVSVQSGFHVFHNGPEHRFLMKEAGCQVLNIETDPAAAQKMAVVVDDSNFEPGKTAFNELSMFGTYQATRKYTCQKNFQVYILKKR
jgi:hypothetical protein